MTKTREDRVRNALEEERAPERDGPRQGAAARRETRAVEQPGKRPGRHDGRVAVEDEAAEGGEAALGAETPIPTPTATAPEGKAADRSASEPGSGAEVQLGGEEASRSAAEIEGGGASETAAAGEIDAAGEADRGTDLESELETLRAESVASAEKLRALRKERDTLYERWLRATADLDNYRKRIDRERDEFRRSALEAVLIDLVQVLDNFDRALSAVPPDAPKGVVDGVRLIHRQLLDLVGKRGLVSMERASGQFDPRFQEAVATEVSSDVPHHEVLEEVQKGYLYLGRVLRPALVKVSVRPDEEASEGPAEGAS